jgi:hypothetical protein
MVVLSSKESLLSVVKSQVVKIFAEQSIIPYNHTVNNEAGEGRTKGEHWKR